MDTPLRLQARLNEVDRRLQSQRFRSVQRHIQALDEERQELQALLLDAGG